MKLTAAENIASVTSCKFSSLLPAAGITALPKLWDFIRVTRGLTTFCQDSGEAQVALVSRGICSEFPLSFICLADSLLPTPLALLLCLPGSWAGSHSCTHLFKPGYLHGAAGFPRVHLKPLNMATDCQLPLSKFVPAGTPAARKPLQALYVLSLPSHLLRSSRIQGSHPPGGDRRVWLSQQIDLM